MNKIDFAHISVLLDECIVALNIDSHGIYVDGTAGGAGHSAKIAQKLTTGKLIAIDKDPQAVMVAKERLAIYPTAEVVQGDFKDTVHILDNLKINKIDGMLLDLGVSSYQLDTGERGFSYNFDAPLDMRMSQAGLSAYEVVNSYSVEDLSQILRNYGEERFAYRIAQNIVKTRAEKPLETTLELAEIIKAAIPAATRREGGHPAKRSFQAIRIAVNEELDNLNILLDNVFELLNSKARLAIITFHSLEDRIVKQKFSLLTQGCTCPSDFPICVCGKLPKARLINKKPIVASAEEITTNKRSRSAKLRVLEKL